MALPFTDTFTGTDGTALSTYDANWVTDAGAIQIQINHARSTTTGGRARWTGDTPTADQSTAITIYGDGSDGAQSMGAGVRFGSSANSGYVYSCNVISQSLYRIDTGTPTLLGSSVTFTNSIGDIIKLSVTGTTLDCTLNGSTTNAPAQQTDATYASGDWELWFDSAGTNIEADSITVDNIGSAPTGIPIFRRRLMMRAA